MTINEVGSVNSEIALHPSTRGEVRDLEGKVFKYRKQIYEKEYPVAEKMANMFLRTSEYNNLLIDSNGMFDMDKYIKLVNEKNFIPDLNVIEPSVAQATFDKKLSDAYNLGTIDRFIAYGRFKSSNQHLWKELLGYSNLLITQRDLKPVSNLYEELKSDSDYMTHFYSEKTKTYIVFFGNNIRNPEGKDGSMLF